MATITGEKALQGAKELDEQLQALGKTMANKLLRGALGASMKPTLALWRASMREGTRMHRTYKGRLVAPGFSRRNSTIYTHVSKDGERVSATVGARDEAFYNLLFIETTGFQGGRGRRARGIVKPTRVRSKRPMRTGTKVPPDPKLVPAFSATRGIALSLLVKELGKRIDKATRTRRADG